MKFIKRISRKKFFIISTILFSYTVLNFLEGERGLISFYNNTYLRQKDAFFPKSVTMNDSADFRLMQNLIFNNKNTYLPAWSDFNF